MSGFFIMIGLFYLGMCIEDSVKVLAKCNINVWVKK